LKNILLLLCIFALVGCLLESSNQSSEFIRVEIAERVFKIPKGYLDGRKAIGKDTESIVLEYSLPDFEVLPKHPQERAARQELIKQGRMRGMLLERSDKRPSFNVMVENILRPNPLLPNQPYSGETEQIYGLQKYPSQKIHPDSDTQYDDLYVERGENNQVISFLRCRVEGRVKHPSCAHKFRDKGLLYQIRWSKSELPNWEKQKDAAIKFIDNFEIIER